MTNNSRQVAVRIFTPGGAYTDHVSEALCTEETKRRGRDGFGDAGRAVYLLRGGSVMPGAGDIITDGDREHEITEIEICRDLAGKIRAVKCTTVN